MGLRFGWQSIFFWAWAAPEEFQNHLKKWGASPSTFLNGFETPRGLPRLRKKLTASQISNLPNTCSARPCVPGGPVLFCLSQQYGLHGNFASRRGLVTPAERNDLERTKLQVDSKALHRQIKFL